MWGILRWRKGKHLQTAPAVYEMQRFNHHIQVSCRFIIDWGFGVPPKFTESLKQLIKDLLLSGNLPKASHFTGTNSIQGTIVQTTLC